MTNEIPPDAGQLSVEHSSFLHAANTASSAFAGEYHAAPLADHKLGRDAGSAGAHLPKLEAHGSDRLSSLEHDLPGRIVKTIGVNEGALTRITRNDNSYGISIGIRQWNQKVGELPSLFRAMHSADPAKFSNVFGPYAKSLLHEDWVRHADMAGNPDLMKRISRALHDPEFQQVQVDKAREFAQKSIQTARGLGLKTEQGAALVADVVNQLGEGGARRVFRRAGLHPGVPVKDEKAALLRMERMTFRPNSRARYQTVALAFNDGALIDDPQGFNSSDLI